MVRESINRIGVVGAGTMGSGIAQVAATAGYDVIVRDLEEPLLERGRETVSNSLDRLVESDRLERTDADDAREQLSWTTNPEDLADCDAVIEAVAEDIDIKQDVFATLDELLPADVLCGTNTSTLSITTIAGATDTPARVVGIHFMNPVPIMEGVEIVVGEQTTDAAVARAHDLGESLGKTTWEADDKPGFVTNRILMPWLNEGIRAYDEGVATKDDIDRGMRLGTNAPMGPLELADHIGLDICLQASQTLHDELGDRYKPAYLLKRKVAAGDLGKKTGAGFYEYE